MHKGLASAFAVALTALAGALIPPPPMDVNAWAAEHRVVAAESGSPYPGRWNPALVPYAPEIQACLSFDHPSSVRRPA